MQVITTVAIPAAVFVLMLVVGLELTPADFRRVAQHPKSTVVGTLAPLVVFPLIAGAAILTLKPGEPIVAGIVLIAAAPGAPISNLLVYIGRGNTALSVTLTALGNTIGIATFPLLATGGLLLYLGEQADIGIPLGPMVQQLVVLMLVPIALGMFVRHRRPLLVAQHSTLLRRISLLMVVGIVTFVVIDQRSVFAQQFVSAIWLAALLTTATMAVGFSLGWLLRAPFPDRIAFLVEFSARNTAIAIVVAATTLGRLDYAMFIVAYFVVQIALTLGVLAALRLKGSAELSQTLSQRPRARTSAHERSGQESRAE
jgi:BASS family bile acid:Na+ symporter